MLLVVRLNVSQKEGPVGSKINFLGCISGILGQ